MQEDPGREIMTAPQAVPSEHEALVRLIHDRFDGMSKTYKKIALFLVEHPNDVAMLSVNAIANRCGVHASSFVRFAQFLGYSGFRELQGLFHQRLSSAAPGYETRVRALETRFAEGEARSDHGMLRDLVVRDMAALQDLLGSVDEAELQRAVRMLERADTVFVAGQLRSSPIAELLRYLLTMLGKRAVLLDAGGGLAPHIARTMGPRDALIAISFRHYAHEVVAIAEEAKRLGTPVLTITDTTLSPLSRTASVLFAIPEHDYTFSRSLAAPMCLAQALMVALAARLQEDRITPRIPTVTKG
jgi:DNA-binding MurR/RpiR family transcriptional regulator